MKRKLDVLRYKQLITPVLLGLLGTHSYALPNILGTAHHPIHYKPNTPHFMPTGLTPGQVSSLYGFDQIKARGEGQIIAIVDAFDDPNIEKDLGVFSKQFNLPACTTANGCFKKVYASGKKPKTDPGWSGEIALDVEWAHAMAPKAKIILVEAQDASMNGLFQAVQVAINSGAQVVSMSWGGAESAEQTSLDHLFNNAGITFTASSGDSGEGTNYPAASPYVLAVGGTTLNVDYYGKYYETAWSGSSGGVSGVEVWPASQSGLPIPASNNMRGVPDVAYNADPQTGFSVYNSVPGGEGGVGWGVIGGTSAGAPQWAAIIAVANSQLKTVLGGSAAQKLYAAVHPNTGNYSSYYNDITQGTNGDCGYYCTAQIGYDYVTGLGSPILANLIPNLQKY